MFDGIKRMLGLSPKRQQPDVDALRIRAANAQLKARRAIQELKASYDSAFSSTRDARHWANADDLSAAAANSPDVRKELRRRARFEVANNSYAKGMVLSLANAVIGTGPRLQVLTPDTAFNKRFEAAFAQWSLAVGFAQKLRTMAQAKVTDGESFAMFISNPRLPTSVQLDLKLIETEQVSTPSGAFDKPAGLDGLVLDAYGNVTAYHLLKNHPGDSWNYAPSNLPTSVSAEHMMHWFRGDRPGQLRGVPEFTSSIPLFAQLRRLTLATLTANETAANLSVVLQTMAMAITNDEEQERSQDTNAFDTTLIERGMMTTVPEGYVMSQMKAEHPNATYEMFKRELLKEIARCMNVPYNIAAGDSSAYNYASGRLDHQNFFVANNITRSDCQRTILDPTLYRYVNEAVMVEGILPPAPQGYSIFELPHRWGWDGYRHVDPVKEATANKIAHASMMTTLQEIAQEDGEDADDRIDVWIAEQKKVVDKMREAGILGIVPLPGTQVTPVPPMDENGEPFSTADRPAGVAA